MIRPAVGRLRRRLRAIAGLFEDARGPALVWIALGWLLVLGIRFVIPAILPRIKAEFAIDNATAGMAVTVLWITYAFMQFPAGMLADRIGERPLLTGAAVLTAVSLLAFGVVPTFWLFLVAGAAFGLGTGLYGPPRGMALSKIFERREGLAFGTVLAAGSIGAAVLPFLGTLFAVRGGWRLAIVAFVPAFVVVGVGLWRAVPADLPSGGAGVPVGDVLRGTRRAVTDRTVLVAATAAMLMVFVFQGMTAFLTTYLVEVKGLDQGTAGALFAVLFVSGALFQSAVGSAADRFGYPRVLVGIGIASALPLIALPFVGGIAPLVVVSVFLGTRPAIAPVQNSYIVGILPADVQGSAWGLIRTAFFTLGSFGSIVVGALADRGLFGEAFLALAALSIVATVLHATLPPREVADGADPDAGQAPSGDG